MQNITLRGNAGLVAGIVATLTLGQALTIAPTTAYAVTLSQARSRLSEIQDEYEATSDQIEETERRLEELKGDIEKTEDEVKKKEESLHSKQDALSAMMAWEYKAGTGSFLDVVMSAESIDALSVNLRYYNETNEADQDIIADTKKAKKELDDKKSDLEHKRDDEENTAKTLREKADDLSRQQNEAKDLVNQLEEEERQRLLAEARARMAAALAASANQSNNDGGDNGGEEGGGDPAPAPAPVNPGDAGVVDFARQFVGTPYVYGGASPSGFDCSGFVSYVWGNYGVSLPRSTYSMISWAQGNGTWTSDYSQLGAGDPVFTHSGHVLLVVSPSSDWGSMTVIHSPRPGRSVCIERIYQRPIGGIRLT